MPSRAGSSGRAESGGAGMVDQEALEELLQDLRDELRELEREALRDLAAAIAAVPLASAAHAQEDLSPRVKAAIIEECSEAGNNIDLKRECFNDVVSVAKAIESNPAQRFKDHPSVDPSTPPPPGFDTMPSCKAALILCKDRPCYAQVGDLAKRGATCELAE